MYLPGLDSNRGLSGTTSIRNPSCGGIKVNKSTITLLSCEWLYGCTNVTRQVGQIIFLMAQEKVLVSLGGKA